MPQTSNSTTGGHELLSVFTAVSHKARRISLQPPQVSDNISSRRHNTDGQVLLPRDVSCSDAHTANNGLAFTTACNQQIVTSSDCDAVTLQVQNFGECIEFCSFQGPICYGVNFSNGTCVLKQCPITSNQITTSTSWNIAVANPTQLTPPTNQACPESDLSVSTSSSGLQCTVQCNENLVQSSVFLQWSGFAGPHAATLDECVNLCAASHPFCIGVGWTPGMQGGYANCQLKGHAVSHQPSNDTHSCSVLNDVFSKIDVTSQPTYTTSSGSIFNVTQYDGRSGATNTSAVHADSIEPCVEACAKNSTCQGVVLDLSMAAGYQNCYLLSALGTARLGVNATFARLSGTHVASTSPSQSSGAAAAQGNTSINNTSVSTTSISNSSVSNTTTNNAWIAGPAVGALLLLVFLVAFLLWRRRGRNMRRNYNPQGSTQSLAQLERETVTLYEKDGSQSAAMMMFTDDNRHELSSHVAPVELSAGEWKNQR